MNTMTIGKFVDELAKQEDLPLQARLTALQQLSDLLFGLNSAIRQRLETLRGTETMTPEIASFQTFLTGVSKTHTAHENIGVPAGPPPDDVDQSLLYRISDKFWSSALGRIVLGIVALSLVALGGSATIMSVQTINLLKIKSEAETAGNEAKSSTLQAQQNARNAVATISAEADSARKTLAAVEASRPEVIQQAAKAVADKADNTAVAQRAVQQIKDQIQPRLNDSQRQLDALQERSEHILAEQTALKAKQSDLAEAESDARKWRETVAGKQETLRDTAFTQATWAAMRNQGWMAALSLLLWVCTVGWVIFKSLMPRWRKAK